MVLKTSGLGLVLAGLGLGLDTVGLVNITGLSMARGCAYAKIEYVSERTYLSNNRILV